MAVNFTLPKPRLRYVWGLWHCGSRRLSGTGGKVSVGIGYTPLQAYGDWVRMCE